MWCKKSLSVLAAIEKKKFIFPEKFVDSEEEEVFWSVCNYQITSS